MKHVSPSSLPDDVKALVARTMNDALLDVLALGAVARKAHWNVRGPAFGPLHKLFGDLYAKTNDHADILAEHIAMLGMPVHGDHVDVAEDAQVDRVPDDTTDGLALCKALFEATSPVLAQVDAAVLAVGQAGDRNGEQLLLDTSVALHKLGWKLAAHLPAAAPQGDDADA